MTTDTKVLLAPVIDYPAQATEVSNKIEVKGHAEPGAIVEIAKSGDDHHLYLKLITSQDGTWAGDFGEDLSVGAHAITARQTHKGRESPWSRARLFSVK